jgi:hypothetical protein
MSVTDALKMGFDTLFDELKGTVVYHKNFGCANPELVELAGLKNYREKDESKVIFQFQKRFELTKGDVLQQKAASDLWKIVDWSDRVEGDTFICFEVEVVKN